MKRLLLPLMMLAAMAQGQVSPFDYGLREATSGMGRYFALLNAHRAALEKGCTVDYSGIDTLRIELPPSFTSIPLGPRTDFGGLVVYVTNHAHHGALFALSGTSSPVTIDKTTVDKGDFTATDELRSGDKLLVLSDKTPWTERRGYGYKHYRADLLMLHNGLSLNAPIAPWDTDSTLLAAAYYDIDTSAKLFRGLTLHRTAESTCKTYCLAVSGQCNLLVEQVRVTTPRSRMIADGVFSVVHSARITFRDVTVEGTYSGYGRTRNYGYAFSLNNVWGAVFERVQAHGNWGVFGSNNLSHTRLIDCDLDRFDIHCYGRDAYLRGCTLRQRQTQFSSMYGTVRFDSCLFTDCIPVRIRSSYNAYTPFDIVMTDCTFRLTPRYHSLVNVMLLDTADNGRPELREKCWPNLRVERMTVVVPWTVGRMNLFHPTGTRAELRRKFGHLARVEVVSPRMIRPGGAPASVPIRLSSQEFQTSNPLTYTIE